MTASTRKQRKRVQCYEKPGDTLNEYRRIRDALRATKSRRKCEECCAALDRLWRAMNSRQQQTLANEFVAHEKLK